MANLAANKVLNLLFAGQIASDVESSKVETILKILAATGGDDVLTGPAEVVRRVKLLANQNGHNTLAVTWLETFLNSAINPQAARNQ